MEDQTANRAKSENVSAATPEQVVTCMSAGEVQELLFELGMNSDMVTAQRLKALILELGQFELAIAAIGGPASLGHASKTSNHGYLRRAG
ncbi:hypothetical protein OAF37_01620 [Rubripirellula sp.]|nr:hypothetical protein [Rubripirellula sp.]MDA7873685.1 hypothetical protein [Rhodopirellula sp.]MDB4644733.1 hypothetical protein [Rubripirellula sp.]